MNTEKPKKIREFNKANETKKFWPEGISLEPCRETISRAIVKACGDFMARTETVQSDLPAAINEATLSKLLQLQTPELSQLKELQKYQGEDLLTRLDAYFNDSEEQVFDSQAFDKWHHDTCEIILNMINEKYEKVSYGKAQKILNMTFKYLYCTKYSKHEKEKYFQHCHMPLDSFTLEWLYRNTYPFYRENEIITPCSDSSTRRICKERTPSWSNIEYSESTDRIFGSHGKYNYNAFRELIKKYFNDYQDHITPLQAEFIIWREIQLELATEAFYAQTIKHLDPSTQQEKGNIFKQKTLNEKFTTVKNLLNENNFE